MEVCLFRVEKLVNAGILQLPKLTEWVFTHETSKENELCKKARDCRHSRQLLSRYDLLLSNALSQQQYLSYSPLGLYAFSMLAFKDDYPSIQELV